MMSAAMPVQALNTGEISLSDFIQQFILTVKGYSPDIGHVIVVFDNVVVDQTVGMGNIAGVKDMNRCVELLKNYVETLEAGIPKLH